MFLHVPVEVTGLAALAGLLLLPGLLIVRSPWVYVPLLSVSFWVVSWWWLLPLGVSREPFLRTALVSFSLLAALRLLKPMAPRLPPWWILLVLGASLLQILPFVFWLVAPGTSFQSLTAELLVWRDGIPLTYEPLIPMAALPPDISGMASLSADVSALSGLPPHRATLLVSSTSHGLLQLALFGFLSTFFRPRTAALAAVISFGLAAPVTRDPTPRLALALLFGAAGLLSRGGGRSSALAGGALLGAALVTDPLVAVLGPGLLPFVWCANEGRSPRVRLGTALGVALGVAWPFLAKLTWPVEITAGTSLEWPLGMGPALAGLLRGPLCWTGFLGLALPRLRGDPGPPLRGLVPTALLFLLALSWQSLCPFLLVPERLVGLLCPLLALGVASLTEALTVRPVWASRGALGALLALAADGAHREYALASSQVPVSGDDIEAAAWIREHTGPLDVICAGSLGAGPWLPALAGRPIAAPVVPPWPGRTFLSGRPCRWRYVWGGAQRASPPRESPVFQNGSVTLWRWGPGRLTNFDNP